MPTQRRTRQKASVKPKDHPVRLNITPIGIGPVKRADVSRQLENQDEVWAVDTQGGQFVITTPYAMRNLQLALDISNVLRQCIESYVVNIASYGYRVVPRHENEDMDPKERAKLQSYIEYANPEESLSTVMRKEIFDYEHFGFGYLEIVRNKKGSIGLIKQVKAHNTRIAKGNDEMIPVTVEINRGGSTRATVVERRRFRKYIQQFGTAKNDTVKTDGRGYAKIWFKEFGDPRRMSYITGQYESDLPEGQTIPNEELATEIIHDRQYSEDSYGVPRWISQLPNIVGSREAEEVNMRYFEDNTVPPALLTVSGGRLTRDSFSQLKTILESEGLGKHRQHKILLIEAVPETAGIDEKGQVKVQLDKLSDSRQSDGLFKDYDEGNMAKVRSAFRLPPALIGLSQDVTFATANVSVFIAETQVFLPERRKHDDLLNKMVVHHPKGLNLKTVKLESRGPQVTNPEQLVKALTALNVMGGLTPRASIDAINEVMDWSLQNYPEEGEEGWEEWMDQPIQLSVRAPRAGENGDETQAESSGKNNEINDAEGGETGQTRPEHGQE